MSTTTGYLPPTLSVNPNVSTKAPARHTIAADWPEVALNGDIVIRRGTHGASIPVLVLTGAAPDEIADYLVALADAITTAAGLEICDGCGFRFDPQTSPAPRFGPDVVDCGGCEA